MPHWLLQNYVSTSQANERGDALLLLLRLLLLLLPIETAPLVVLAEELAWSGVAAG